MDNVDNVENVATWQRGKRGNVDNVAMWQRGSVAAWQRGSVAAWQCAWRRGRPAATVPHSTPELEKWLVLLGNVFAKVV